MYYIYILKCSDGTLYTGSTNDLKKDCILIILERLVQSIQEEGDQWRLFILRSLEQRVKH